MTCCSGHCAAGDFFSSRMAARDLRRYKRRGPDTSTRMLLSELRRLPLRGLHMLDVGSGIGVLDAELADAGLAGVTLVDASAASLEVARSHVSPRYETGSAQFVLGDFALMADTLPDADMITLDRVVCCYPDADALLRAVASRTRRFIAFSYPPDRWYLRGAIAVENFFFRVARSPFRTFVHSPERMISVLETAGFVPAAQGESFHWSVGIFRRTSA